MGPIIGWKTIQGIICTAHRTLGLRFSLTLLRFWESPQVELGATIEHSTTRLGAASCYNTKMSLLHQSGESSSTPIAENASLDPTPVPKVALRQKAQGQKRKFQATDFESEQDQMEERWHRDPFGRENKQSVTKAIENRRNLEEAMYNEGFSQARASKIAFYMTRCEGQFQEWDSIVKKKPRLKQQTIQDESFATSKTEPVPGSLQNTLDEDGEEEENSEEDSDEAGSRATSAVEGGRQRLQELKDFATNKLGPANATTKPRSRKDEIQRRKDRKNEGQRIKEYATYTYEDYVQAARRYDIVYGNAEKLYRLAEERATRLLEERWVNHPPTTEMMIQRKWVDVEDPTFGITQPSADEALAPEERRARDQQNKQLWVEKQKEGTNPIATHYSFPNKT